MDIEKVKKITNRVECIDGEQVYIIDHNMNKELDKLKELSKKNKDSSEYTMLSADADFVKSHSDFGIAFRPIRSNGNIICMIPCVICKFQGEWRRVQMQYVHCLDCSWKGEAANPTSPELYCLMKDEFEVLRRMWKLPFCICPKCGGKLSTQAIWIEGKESEPAQKQ